MFDFFYKRSYTLFSLIAALFFMGVVGLKVLPRNLFPDSSAPEVIVVTKAPGATAQVVANTISKPIEQEVARLGLVTDVSSVNVANFSIVKIVFGYKKSLNAAAVDVSNALSIVKSKLPQSANPAVYTVGDFTLPVDVISLSPKDKSIDLSDVRKVADSFIKPYLLGNPNIGNVEVFGGYQSSINIEVDPFRAKKYDIDFATIAKSIRVLNKDLPIGFTKGEHGFYTISFYGERDNIEKLKNLSIRPNIKLSDIADVKWSYKKRTSAYIGNGKEAIALSIQRAPGGSVLGVSDTARSAMKGLSVKYPHINFEISDTQRDLVKQSNGNMLEALRDAIIYTLIVLIFFLGNFKAIIAAGLSIPMVFLSTIAFIWLSGGGLNLIIYTAIIVSLGMLTDDAVVVLENIERHLKENHEDLNTAIVKGTKEVIVPILIGTLSTVVMLFPLMFVGGFPQQIFKPFISTLIISLIISYFLSITFIPLLSKWLYRNGVEKTKIELFFEKFYENTIGRMLGGYIGILKFSNGKYWAPRRMLLTAMVVLTMVLSVKNIMPLVGKDAMPPMDTGIIKANIGFSVNETVNQAEEEIQPFIVWLKKQKWYKMSSIAFGSEAGVLSIGSGSLPSEATITINAVDRFSRKKTIWQLENDIRTELAKLKNVKKDDVFDFGATAVSTIKAPLVASLRSFTIEGLPAAAKKVSKTLQSVKGLTSISTSWSKDETEYELKIDENKALSYGITPYGIVEQLPIKGQVIGLNGDLESMNTQFVRLYLKGKFADNIQTLRLLPIKTQKGEIPLATIATFTPHLTYAKIERDKMQYSIDVGAYRAKRPITHITDDAVAAIKKAKIEDIKILQAGDVSQIGDSFTRMAKAIVIGIILLILVLVSGYKSVRLALAMIVVLPLSMIGATWGMLLFDKSSSMPALMGILLLFGIIIKNAVLLVDFYLMHREKNESPFDSAIESVKVRFRPVMMTAFGTIAGMLPIALEQAVGLERLSPLADVAIGGLLIGTLLTLIYVPMYSYVFDKDSKSNPVKKMEEEIEEII